MSAILGFFKKNKLIAVALVAYLVVLVLSPETFRKALQQNGAFLWEMLQILPPIMVISALISVWVPNETIMKGFGNSSGLKGKVLSVLIGAFSAGPIYAAFPVAKTLFDKGASVGNVVIILSAWAVVKVPMYLVETSFLGARFANTRYLLTIPFILAMGVILQRLVKREDLPLSEVDREIQRIEQQLPGRHCGACGCTDCHAFAVAVREGKMRMEECKVLGKSKAG
ncbi:MAG TPA: permease [Thermotogota bacterium]|nr:permease [Thermotogota bacterium]HRW93982.1 permease [Thermotogota bacterium]